MNEDREEIKRLIRGLERIFDCDPLSEQGRAARIVIGPSPCSRLNGIFDEQVQAVQ